MSEPRKQLPPMLPPKRREKDETFDFLREPTTITRRTRPNQARPKLDSRRVIITNKPSQGAGSSRPSTDPRSVAPIKPSKSTAHPPRSRTMGPPPLPRVVASPQGHRSPINMALAEPSRSAPPSQERTYLREKASSKPSSVVARPPRPVRPSHDTGNSKPSKPATPLPLPIDPNMFLAGKLAYEYLTSETLFGKPYVSTEADFPPAPSSPSSTHVGKTIAPSMSNTDSEKETEKGTGKAIELTPKPKPSELEQQSVNNLRYINVSNKLMSREMHIPGIVNPSQLVDFLNRHPEVE